MMNSAFFYAATVAFLLAAPIQCKNQDMFNYRRTVGNNYGPEDWDKVKCENHRNCPGWPDDWETYNANIPYVETGNSCKDCSLSDEGNCHLHKQSPIHLVRNITSRRECQDRHWMAYKRGTCKYRNMRFRIEPHALRAYQPMDGNGNSLCEEPSSIDFSWGFPDWWHLVHTDITIPSEHMQDGKRYDAEVVLAHIYSKDKPNRHIGKVAVFLEKGEESDRYDFLDMYLKRWKRVAREIKEDCDLRESNSTARRQMETNGPNRLRGFSDSEEVSDEARHLGQRTFTPYDWLKRVETEYYFRYEGSQGVPPCLEIAHWRVMKSAIKVAPSQIDALERLMRSQRDKKTCKKGKAGRRHNGDLYFNRPIQTTTRAHRVVFCECTDWTSKQPADLQWCRKSDAERGVSSLIIP